MPVRTEIVRFGVFELDLTEGALTKNGHRINLQEQPLRLLSILLQHPGETVTREQLRQALWQTDTFVDFDRGLNAAMAKLRHALGDSADNPRFIETQARRGYRFIAPVTHPVETAGTTPVEFTADSDVAFLAPATQTGSPRTRNLSRGVVLMGVAVLITLAAVIFLFRRPAYGSKLVQITENGGLTMDPAISPDGKLLAYASDRGSSGNRNIWIQQLGSSGRAVQLTHETVDADEPAFSPDGSTIAFRSKKQGSGIYLVPTIGGEPVLLARDGRLPRFSPDGRWIAYTAGGLAGNALSSANHVGAVFVIASAGGKPQRLAPDLRAAQNPVWSPDNRRLLFYVPPHSSYFWDEADFWIASLDGTASRRTGLLDALKRQGFSMRFGRDPRVTEWKNGFITFAADFGDSFNIWRAPFSDSGHPGGPASRLTSGTNLDVEATTSPNGELYFASLHSTSALWSLEGDTESARFSGGLTKLTNGPGDYVPSISTDGRRLAFLAVRRRDLGLDHASDARMHVLEVGSGKETQLADTVSFESRPQISHDGSMIAYETGKTGRIFAAPLDGGTPRLLVGIDYTDPWDWSHDNKRLLFGGEYPKDPRIHMLDLASGKTKDLLSKSGFYLYQSKFSPDDEAIAISACTTAPNGNLECRIFIVPMLDGAAAPAEKWIEINHVSNWDDKPRWSPDGRLLYFLSDRDGYLCLWAQKIDIRHKRSVDLPFPVYHFHSSRLAMSNLGTGWLEIDVAKNRIVLDMRELTGDIWKLAKQ